MFERPKILLSRCLGISPVRFNGGIINDTYIERLKNFVEIKDICPEVDIGLGVPRPRMSIRKIGAEYRFVEYESGRDFTSEMIQYCKDINKIAVQYDGAVLKAKSPSCGIDNANFYNERNNRGKTDGFLGSALKEIVHFPLTDEGRLRDEGLRYRFLTAVFSLSDFREGRFDSGGDFVKFHTRYKYLLMTFSPKSLKAMGQIVADGNIPPDKKLYMYRKHFAEAFSRTPSVKRHYNTLLHIFGYFSDNLKSKERNHFLRLAEGYL
ncbi:MAG: DUF523 and DUF1722 domain-containing protein, partial [Deltaproteobacteria bacterium]|nr:DUF523 and DUF1722 domain-containing protein [Deltaproteobacteria bacterium]